MCLADVNRVRNGKLLGKKLLAMDYTIRGWFLAGNGLRDCGENGFAAGNVSEERCSPNVGRGRVIVGIFTEKLYGVSWGFVCWGNIDRSSHDVLLVRRSEVKGKSQRVSLDIRRESSLFTSSSAFSSAPLRDKISSCEFHRCQCCSIKTWIVRFERGKQ